MGISPSGGSLGITQSVNTAINNLVSVLGWVKAKAEIDKMNLKKNALKSYYDVMEQQNRGDQLLGQPSLTPPQQLQQQAGQQPMRQEPMGQGMPSPTAPQQLKPQIPQTQGVSQLMNNIRGGKLVKGGWMKVPGGYMKPSANPYSDDDIEFKTEAEMDREKNEGIKLEGDILKQRRETPGTAENTALQDSELRQTLRVESAKSKISVDEKSKNDFNIYTDAFSKNIIALNKLDRYAKKLPEFPRGFIGQTGARADAAIKTYSKDKAFTQYLGVVSQEIIPLARNEAEEKGPIAETDVDRIEKGLGSPTTPLEDKLLLTGELRAKTSQSIIMKMEKSGLTLEQLATDRPNLFNMLKKSIIDYTSVVPEDDMERFNTMEELDNSLLFTGSPALVIDPSTGKLERAIKGF